MLTETNYDRLAAVEYARLWALSRNPEYYDFDSLGGDCTNFISQCIFAGCKVMNYTKDTGWYYSGLNDRSAAWTGVEYLYRFLISNKETGPYAELTNISSIQPGDIIQLGTSDEIFYHSCIAVKIQYGMPYIAAHTNDAYNLPLSSYSFGHLRCLHITGARKYV